MGLSEHDLQVLKEGEVIQVLGVYLSDVKLGYNMKGQELLADTIRGYINAAHTVLELIQQCQINIHDRHGNLVPYLREQINLCSAWEQKLPKKEPYSVEMFEWLHNTVHDVPDVSISHLGVMFAVFDWQRLGVFTGSRLSEYGQSKIPKGERFNTIPKTPEAGIWAGRPIAFIREDFKFYDAREIEIVGPDIFMAHENMQLEYLEICFRFDKSRNNFLYRKYRRTDHPIFCPVDAAVSILLRAQRLCVHADHPVGVTTPKSKKYQFPYRFLTDYDVKVTMRKACMEAHDEDHYLRKRINSIVPHSNRVTAAVCLQLGGAHNDEIAFQLRWHVDSVPIYLRHCFKGVGDVLTRVVNGVLRQS